MKMIKRVIESLIAISVIPTIVLIVVSVTELKDVKNVQYELLTEEEGKYIITPGTFEKLMKHKRIKNYDIESNYPLITREEMDRAMWQVEDIINNTYIKNEIYIDENGEKRIIVNVGRLILDETNIRITSDGERVYVVKPVDSRGIGRYVRDPYFIPGYNIDQESAANVIFITHDTITDVNELRQSLVGKPLYYELRVKNPMEKVIERNDLTVMSDYVRMVKPEDFSNNPNGLLISSLMNPEQSVVVDRFEVIDNWIYVYPRNITVEELANRMVGKTLTYELAKPRPVEVYDFSKFRLVFHKNRIRVTFDIDDSYYLWEITNDDKMIPINGQYDLGNVWTVKFYVYEIQQPLIRTLVLLIPLIVISGLLLYLYNLIKKKENE